MAEWKSLIELRNYQLSNGRMADLLALIGTYKEIMHRETWVAPSQAPEIGTVAYVDAMGDMRRGVVVKTTKTKTYVAVTTQGAVDSGLRYNSAIRVQIVIADTNYIRVAPAPAIEVETVTEDEAVAAIQAATVAPTRLAVVQAQLALTEDEIEENAAQSDAENLADAEAARTENEATGGMYYGSEWASSPAFDIDPLNPLTLHSQDGKVDSMTNEAPTETRETTGSAVVKLLERVHERIRQNHLEVPAMIIVTGRGIGAGQNKWGHFQAHGWTTGETSIHEMFMAGETLARGAGQVLQTMLHESAHALAATRGKKDTSRQGRWHNAEFLGLAKELGLEYRHGKADSKIGFSGVTLTDETREEYADLMKELDAEIHLMVSLPGWIGGQDGDEGGENIGKAPKTGEPSSSSLKLTCTCDEPNIIRASKKVAEKMAVQCTDCDSLFRDRG